MVHTYPCMHACRKTLCQEREKPVTNPPPTSPTHRRRRHTKACYAKEEEDGEREIRIFTVEEIGFFSSEAQVFSSKSHAGFPLSLSPFYSVFRRGFFRVPPRDAFSGGVHRLDKVASSTLQPSGDRERERRAHTDIRTYLIHAIAVLAKLWIAREKESRASRIINTHTHICTSVCSNTCMHIPRERESTWLLDSRSPRKPRRKSR